MGYMKQVSTMSKNKYLDAAVENFCRHGDLATRVCAPLIVYVNLGVSNS
jgi:hypothetical protein